MSSVIDVPFFAAAILVGRSSPHVGHTAEALLMTSEQGDIFDKAYYKIPGIGMKERALWAMLAAVDVHSR